MDLLREDTDKPMDRLYDVDLIITLWDLGDSELNYPSYLDISTSQRIQPQLF